jgi:hypothetical protein
MLLIEDRVSEQERAFSRKRSFRNKSRNKLKKNVKQCYPDTVTLPCSRKGKRGRSRYSSSFHCSSYSFVMVFLRLVPVVA